ncbi:hypothetical protein NLX86_18100 [Streptomyces sp. A3M-1-3]|uniref:hypothetical protein n=1 Tax=Streptomyces sp. A3M-1-3 TaxID=2962044 RepID=UPI0020B75A7B|nr:hypothetical protein [Streptomyces sp. A3M-1-3]MCP3819937.1 hypothetical protein [Streptomyces sp. A3M-1-3]
MHGYDTGPADTPAGSTLIGPRARTAVLHGTVTDRGGTVFAALASLTAEPDPAPVATLARVTVTGRRVDVAWQDGSTAALVLTEDLSQAATGARICGPYGN